MIKNFFLKKKIFDAFSKASELLHKAFVRLYKVIFAKRTVLLVTNDKIRTINLGPILQGALLITIIWVGHLFIQSLRYNSVINSKIAEIDRLNSVNSYFSQEFDILNEKLKKVNEYLISVTGSVHKVNETPSNFKEPRSFKEKDLSKEDKETMNLIKDAEAKLAVLKSVTQTRIGKIENAINITGLNIKNLPQKQVLNKAKSQEQNFSLQQKEITLDSHGQGGPLVEEDDEIDKELSKMIAENEKKERDLDELTFKSEIDYLMVLEKLAILMPLSRPMKNYYISSGFGRRVDPITGRMALHRGLDFVGVNKEKIISPSQGKVVLAGKYSAYGNAIVIDHGFGISSRYGHLSAIKVKKGQIVKKGDLIALQGSSGRSTGPHLHYEVRYKNIPLNPRKFIQAGEALFNSQKYADS